MKHPTLRTLKNMFIAQSVKLLESVENVTRVLKKLLTIYSALFKNSHVQYLWAVLKSFSLMKSEHHSTLKFIQNRQQSRSLSVLCSLVEFHMKFLSEKFTTDRLSELFKLHHPNSKESLFERQIHLQNYSIQGLITSQNGKVLRWCRRSAARKAANVNINIDPFPTELLPLLGPLGRQPQPGKHFEFA